MKLRKVIKLIELIGESKVPEDIVKHLDKEQYSKVKVSLLLLVIWIYTIIFE